MQEIPDFFVILQNKSILNDNYELMTSRRTVLSCIDSYPHEGDNDLDLIISIFNPKYKTKQALSKAMTQNHSNKKIQNLIDFLRREQRKINLNRKI